MFLSPINGPTVDGMFWTESFLCLFLRYCQLKSILQEWIIGTSQSDGDLTAALELYFDG
jgi:hypothetical protein